MSIIKTSNILTFVVDNLEKGFVNLCPLIDPVTGLNLTEDWNLPKWLDHYSIEYNIVEPDNATPDSWYPVSINFWNFQQDYLSVLPERIKDLLVTDRIRILFTYREADDPAQIRDHIDCMCGQHGINNRSVLFVSGNTNAQYVPRCLSFWYFDSNYFFQNQSIAPPNITGIKSHKITCLSRTHKQWRECFVYNILRHQQGSNYISYGTVKNLSFDDFVMWEKNNLYLDGKEKLDILLPDQFWRDTLPLVADLLNSDQHNDHSITVNEHFQGSYWNIVLETLLDGGVFITEKTLKPIRNGQSFIILGCQYSLAYLQEHGYRTFGHVIDESYDHIHDVRQRWYAVYEITKTLMGMHKEDLHSMWQACVPIIDHNQQHFQRSREPALRDLINRLINYRP